MGGRATRTRRLALGGLVGAVALVALLSGASTLERQDRYCAGCHLPPEMTFVARSGAATPVDLAARHAAPEADVRCVDCHGGVGLAGRARSLALGAEDAWRWARGDYTVLGDHYLPSDTLRHPVPDRECRACHEETVRVEGFEYHYHNRLDDAERPPDVTCVACHGAHVPLPLAVADGGADEARAAPVCEACHRVMGGPVGLQPAATATAAR